MPLKIRMHDKVTARNSKVFLIECRSLDLIEQSDEASILKLLLKKFREEKDI